MTRKRVNIDDPRMSLGARKLMKFIILQISNQLIADGLPATPNDMQEAVTELWENGFLQIELDETDGEFYWSLLDEPEAEQMRGPFAATEQ